MEFKIQAEKNLLALKENPYPGRGIIIGTNETGKFLVQVYFIMGRSENSRNRIFIEEEEEIKTFPLDPTKVKDPSLIIYTAMADKHYSKDINGGAFDEKGKQVHCVYAVSNGAQTKDMLEGGIKHSLLKWTYEPDYPNFTPRIGARFVTFKDENPTIAEMAILKKSSTDDGCHKLFYRPPLTAGFGHCITTYNGDGNPLPSFEGEPYVLPLSGRMKDVARSIWDSLNEENRISLVVKFINPDTSLVMYQIINKFKSD